MPEYDLTPEISKAAPAPAMPRMLKWLGLLAVIGGTVMAVAMTMFDELAGRSSSALGSLQILGIVMGICGSLFGILLFAIGSFTMIDARQREILGKLDMLSAQGIKVEYAAPAVTGPVQTPQESVPAPETKAIASEIAPVSMARPELQKHVPRTIATRAVPKPKEEKVRIEEAGQEEQTPPRHSAEPAIESVVAPIPSQPVQEQSAISTEIPEAPTQTADPVPVEAQPEAAPQTADAQQPVYDYSTAAAPNAQSCQVCGTELEDGKCAHCDTSTLIQEVYYDISRAQELGIAIAEANSLLNSARRSMDERAYDEAGELATGARNNLQESTRLFTDLQKSISDSDFAKQKFKDEGKDTGEVAKLITNAKSALAEGRYQDAFGLVASIQTKIEELAKPPAPKPVIPEPPKRAEISACPKCAKKVMAGWKKCPYCLTPLT